MDEKHLFAVLIVILIIFFYLISYNNKYLFSYLQTSDVGNVNMDNNSGETIITNIK